MSLIRRHLLAAFLFFPFALSLPLDNTETLLLAPLYTNNQVDEYPALNNTYIVVFKDDTSEDVQQYHYNFLQLWSDFHPLENSRNGIKNTYEYAIQGYSGYFSLIVLNQIRSRPEVKYVEQNGVVKTSTAKTQNGAPWNLARISSRTFPSGNPYKYERTAGKDTCIYIVDSGIDVEHPELKSVAVWGNLKTIVDGEDDKDEYGHGTSVAGVAGSRTYGVSKLAKLISVKVLSANGTGDVWDVIHGIEWVMEDVKTRKICDKGSVINLSGDSIATQSLDDAVASAVRQGLYFVAAAGNDNVDACTQSPARSKHIITVGATEHSDRFWGRSNHGRCVTLNAPGVDIRTTYKNGQIAEDSGASFASPHVAGLIAYFLSIYPDKSIPEQRAQQQAIERNRLFIQDQSRWGLPADPLARFFAEEAVATSETVKMTPALMKRFLVRIATRNKIGGTLPAGTPDLIAYNNAKLLE